MNERNLIREIFHQGIELKEKVLEDMVDDIAKVAKILTACLLDDKKIMCCGNGGSAADAQHFVAELVNRFEHDRPALPALALTTDSSVLTSIANDFSFDQVFSKQIMALAQSKDVVVIFSTSGNSMNVIRAVEAAHRKNCCVVAITGQRGGELSKIINPTFDFELKVPSENTARIQEIHITIVHCLCTLIDHELFNMAEDLDE